MCYLIEPRERIYVKSYGFLSFAENIGKNLSKKYDQKLVDSAKRSATDSIETAPKSDLVATGDLVGKKIAGKITSYSKKPAKKLQDDELQSNKANNGIRKERFPQERQQIIDELRLI